MIKWIQMTIQSKFGMFANVTHKHKIKNVKVNFGMFKEERFYKH